MMMQPLGPGLMGAVPMSTMPMGGGPAPAQPPTLIGANGQPMRLLPNMAMPPMHAMPTPGAPPYAIPPRPTMVIQPNGTQVPIAGAKPTGAAGPSSLPPPGGENFPQQATAETAAAAAAASAEAMKRSRAATNTKRWNTEEEAMLVHSIDAARKTHRGASVWQEVARLMGDDRTDTALQQHW